MPTNAPVKFGSPGGGFVRENAGVERPRQPLPRRTADSIGEAQPLVVHVDAQFDGTPAATAMGGVNASAVHLIGQRRHHAQMLAVVSSREM